MQAWVGVRKAPSVLQIVANTTTLPGTGPGVCSLHSQGTGPRASKVLKHSKPSSDTTSMGEHHVKCKWVLTLETSQNN